MGIPIPLAVLVLFACLLAPAARAASPLPTSTGATPVTGIATTATTATQAATATTAAAAGTATAGATQPVDTTPAATGTTAVTTPATDVTTAAAGATAPAATARSPWPTRRRRWSRSDAGPHGHDRAGAGQGAAGGRGPDPGGHRHDATDGNPNVIAVGQVLRLRRPAPGATPTGKVQRALVRLGYRPGPVDGVLGPRTRRAVRQFQEDRHLRVDGIPGPQTRRALHHRFASHRAQPPDPRTPALQPVPPLHLKAPGRSIASGEHHGPPLARQVPLLLGGLLVLIALAAALVPGGPGRRRRS